MEKNQEENPHFSKEKEMFGFSGQFLQKLMYVYVYFANIQSTTSTSGYFSDASLLTMTLVKDVFYIQSLIIFLSKYTEFNWFGILWL